MLSKEQGKYKKILGAQEIYNKFEAHYIRTKKFKKILEYVPKKDYNDFGWEDNKNNKRC